MAHAINLPHTPPLPVAIDSESAATFRLCLMPVFDTAQSWADLHRTLRRKGYDLAFRLGHLVVLREGRDDPIFTGQGLGAPLRSLVARLGRPALRMQPDGLTARLRDAA